MNFTIGINAAVRIKNCCRIVNLFHTLIINRCFFFFCHSKNNVHSILFCIFGKFVCSVTRNGFCQCHLHGYSVFCIKRIIFRLLPLISGQYGLRKYQNIHALFPGFFDIFYHCLFIGFLIAPDSRHIHYCCLWSVRHIGIIG